MDDVDAALERLTEASAGLLTAMLGIRLISARMLLGGSDQELTSAIDRLQQAYCEYCAAHRPLDPVIVELYSIDTNPIDAIGVSGLTMHRALKVAADRDLNILAAAAGNCGAIKVTPENSNALRHALTILPLYTREEFDNVDHRMQREWIKLRNAIWRPAGDKSADSVGNQASATTLDDQPTQPKPEATKDDSTFWLARAMLLVRDHPDWSDATIAENVGKHKSTLSRSREYQAAAQMARGKKEDRPRGFITVDAETDLHDLDAFSTDSPDLPDRGKPIPGSKYFREYCDECREPMKVKKTQVGTKRRCESCRAI
jgi:hypothetical protein